ncbi:MAG: hypothetical protein ABEJ56_03205 [Candidatus Nanohaloarchaea archaeon]
MKDLPSASSEEEFDPDRFYQKKLLPAKNLFDQTQQYSPAMINSWIKIIGEQSESKLQQKSRLHKLLAGTQNPNKTKPGPYVKALDQEFGAEFRRDLEMKLSRFGASEEFAKLSFSSEYPRNGTDEEDVWEIILEEIDRDIIHTVLGCEKHYMAILYEEDMEQIESGILGDMRRKGYIGIPYLNGYEGEAVEVYVRKDLVKKFETRDERKYTL